jgi:hypothetical protein
MLLTKNLFSVEPHLSESKQGEEFSYREDRKKPSTESVDEDSPECVCASSSTNLVSCQMMEQIIRLKTRRGMKGAAKRKDSNRQRSIVSTHTED